MPQLRVAAEGLCVASAVHVVGDEQIEVAVPVEIRERAAGAPQRGAADARARA